MLGQNDIMIKMARTEEYIDEEGDSWIKDFLEHVIRRPEEILSQSSFSSDDRYVSEVLTHLDLFFFVFYFIFYHSRIGVTAITKKKDYSHFKENTS